MGNRGKGLSKGKGGKRGKGGKGKKGGGGASKWGDETTGGREDEGQPVKKKRRMTQVGKPTVQSSLVRSRHQSRLRQGESSISVGLESAEVERSAACLPTF